MSFLDVDIEEEYRIPRDDIVGNFYIPLLAQSDLYERSVGYFSSSCLIKLSYGICQLVRNNGHIRLIASPNLTEEDYDAINKGYEDREKIIGNRMLSELADYDNYYEKERLNLVADLISSGVLEVKIAFSYNEGNLGLYHEKLGLLHDFEGNTIAFSGSMNESKNGMESNYETVDVFKSWINERRVENKQKAFDDLWNNLDSYAKTYEFPDIVREKILKYNFKEANYDIDEEEKEKLKEEYERKMKNTPHKPEKIKLRPYQIDAIESWKNHEYIGIFDMATGTGKTITAISALVRLLEDKEYKMGVVICVPYQHLVTQWNEDLIDFGFNPIMGFTGSPTKKWKEKLKRAIFDYNYGIKKSFCLIVTNDSFTTPGVQEMLMKCKREMVLVVDEAHNFGTKKRLACLNDKYKYRLALSATFERFRDEEGTEELFNYFGEKCIEYTLEEAINQDMLTNYYYHPIVVYLEEDELEKYNQLSAKIAKMIHKDEKGRIVLTPQLKMLLIQRSRYVAGARNKLTKLAEIIEPYKDDKYMLIYCGATNYEGDEVEDNDSDDLKQIEAVQMMLSSRFNMEVCQYTSQETAEERKLITEDFKSGKGNQAIVAIKCLDEGVNIPNIQTAFILASSTNPKEYVQRRGRVLRLAEGKDFATIYDFVTLPRNINELSYEDEINYDASLVKREVARIREFADLSLNESESYDLIEELSEVYGNEIIFNSEVEEVL